MAKRRMNLEKYGISANRRDELVAFTLQYPEWQAALRDLRSLTAVRTDAEAVQGGMPGNPTERTAIRTLEYISKVESVERAVRKAAAGNAGLYEPLLRTVTQGLSYEAAGLPVNRQLFYALVGAYYVNLNAEAALP